MLKHTLLPNILFAADGAPPAPASNASGNGSGTGDGNTTSQAGGTGAPPEDATVSLKQSELNKSYADRAKRAAEKATADLLTAVGVKSADELKALAKKAKDAEAAQLTETKRAAQALTAAQARITELETLNAQTIKATQTLRIRSAVELAAATLKFHQPEDAYLLADTTAITVSDEGKVTGVDSALKALAKARPYLIDGQNQTTPDNDATRRSNSNAPALTDDERRELAARYGVRPEYIK